MRSEPHPSLLQGPPSAVILHKHKLSCNTHTRTMDTTSLPVNPFTMASAQASAEAAAQAAAEVIAGASPEDMEMFNELFEELGGDVAIFGQKIDIDMAQNGLDHTPPELVTTVCDNIYLYTVDDLKKIKNTWYYEKKANSLTVAREKMKMLKLQYSAHVRMGLQGADQLFLQGFKLIACEGAAKCQGVRAKGQPCMNKVNYGSMMCTFHINTVGESEAMEKHITKTMVSNSV